MQWMSSESKDREVWILIALQMAVPVWKSKHFKMKSSNDWCNDHEHTVGKHIQIDDQPHKELSTLLKANCLFVKSQKLINLMKLTGQL